MITVVLTKHLLYLTLWSLRQCQVHYKNRRNLRGLPTHCQTTKGRWLVVPCYWYLCTRHIIMIKKKPLLLSDTRSQMTWFAMMAVISFWISHEVYQSSDWMFHDHQSFKYTILWFKNLRWQKYFLHRETLNKTCNWNARQAMKPDINRWNLADWDKIRMHNNKRNTNFMIFQKIKVETNNINSFFVNRLIN